MRTLAYFAPAVSLTASLADRTTDAEIAAAWESGALTWDATDSLAWA